MFLFPPRDREDEEVDNDAEDEVTEVLDMDEMVEEELEVDNEADEMGAFLEAEVVDDEDDESLSFAA